MYICGGDFDLNKFITLYSMADRNQKLLNKNRFSKVAGLIVLFYSICFLLLVIAFFLMEALGQDRTIIVVLLPPLAIVSVLFTVYVNRKLKHINHNEPIQGDPSSH